MPSSVRERVQKRRDALRAAGLRPVQIWVPDTRSLTFIEACRQQARAVAAADAGDPPLGGFLDAALADVADDAGA